MNMPKDMLDLTSLRFYEAASYINYFATDALALRAAVQIVEELVSIERSYNYFLLQAQLLKKVNEQVQALAAVNKAISLGKKTGEDTKDAEDLLQDLVK
jgi:predicted RNA polymerase sigma factor